MDQNRLLRAKQVADMTGLSVSTFYAKIRARGVPQAAPNQPEHVAWRYSDIVC